MQLITTTIAMVSILTLGLYDFLSICRIIRKEKWAEKLWRCVLPNIRYEEMILFSLIRPTLLSVSAITFILSQEVVTQIPGYDLILKATPLLAVCVAILNVRRNER